MRERAQVFGGEDDILPDVHTPLRKRPDENDMTSVAEKTGFNRSAQKPAATQKRDRKRRYRKKPRNEQVAVRTTEKYHNAFYECLEASGNPHVAGIFEEAVTLLCQKYGVKIEDDS